MSLLLLFGRLAHFARRTVLGDFEVLPGLSFLLTMQTDGTDPHIAGGTVHAEDCALSSWHSREMLLRERQERKTRKDDQEANNLDAYGLG